MNGQNIRLQVQMWMETYHMADGSGILAAVSGGADSVCLLFVLKELKERLGIKKLAAFHLHHGLRGAEADRDADFVKELCGQWGIPLTVSYENVAAYGAVHGISAEEAGRELRYRHLEETAGALGDLKIATAHHQDDQAETVLFNLFRGSGLKGISGIAPVRGNVIRPLLCLKRQEIEEYLLENGICWCEDSTNHGTEFSRNKIRNVLVPWLKEELNPRAVEHILQLSRVAGEADEYFAEKARQILLEVENADEALVPVDGGLSQAEQNQDGRNQAGYPVGIPGTRLPVNILDGQPEIIKEYIIREMISRAAGERRNISERHIRAVLDLGGPGKGSAADLPFGLRAERGYEVLQIVPKKKERDGLEGEPVLLRVFPYKKGWEIPKNQYTKWFDYDKIKDTLRVRTREPGDYFQIAGGRTKTLRRYFIDEKIPEPDRDKIPLLADGNHILWVVGHRISEYYKVTDETVTILEAALRKGEDHG